MAPASSSENPAIRASLLQHRTVNGDVSRKHKNVQHKKNKSMFLSFFFFFEKEVSFVRMYTLKEII